MFRNCTKVAKKKKNVLFHCILQACKMEIKGLTAQLYIYFFNRACPDAQYTNIQKRG